MRIVCKYSGGDLSRPTRLGLLAIWAIMAFLPLGSMLFRDMYMYPKLLTHFFGLPEAYSPVITLAFYYALLWYVLKLLVAFLDNPCHLQINQDKLLFHYGRKAVSGMEMKDITSITIRKGDHLGRLSVTVLEKGTGKQRSAYYVEGMPSIEELRVLLEGARVLLLVENKRRVQEITENAMAGFCMAVMMGNIQ